MVLRQPPFIGLVLVAFAFAITPLRDAQRNAQPWKAGGRTCPQLPSGAEPDVLDGSLAATPNYAVSVTPNGGSRTFVANTSGDTSTFTVTNTGLCTDTYNFNATAIGVLSGITLSKTSFTLASNQSTTVKATYSVGAPNGPQTDSLNLQATANTGGESASGWYNISIVGVSVTPDAQGITVNTNSSQTVRFLLTNNGSLSNTYTLTCSASGNETCGAVIPSKDTLAAGTSDSITVDFTTGAAGSGTLTLQSVGSAGGSDNGSYSVTNATTPPYAVTVGPHTQAISILPNVTQTVPFTLTNSGTTTNTYTLSCSAVGNETCVSASPSKVTVAAGGGGSASVTFTAGAGGTGIVRLRANGLGSAIDSGGYNVTNSGGGSSPPVTRGVTVIPDGQAIFEDLNSTQPIAFLITNTGSATGSWYFNCSAGAHETCNTVTPGSVNLAGGSSAAVSVSFTSDQNAASSSLTLYAVGQSDNYGYNDNGHYNITNASPPPGPNYAVYVTPKSGSDPAWLASTTGHIALFTVQNTGTTSDIFDVTCVGSGTATCPASITSVSLPPNSTASVAVTYGVGAPGSGTLTVTATGQDGIEHDSGVWGVSSTAPIRSVSVLPHGQPLTVSAASLDTLAFQVQNTGQIPDTFTLTCAVTASETCGTVTPSSLVGVGPGVTNAVTVTFTAGAVGTSGTVWLRSVGNSGAKDSGSYVITNSYFVAVTPHGVAEFRLLTHAYTDTFTVRNPGTSSTTYTITASCSGSAVASGCTPSPTSLTLAAGASGAGTVAYTTGAAGTTGVVKLIATANGASVVKDSGWSSLTIGTAQASTVDIASVNPGTTRERALCLTIAAGAAGAAECGDLRLVHPLPGTRTLNKLRAPTLLYNSAEAKPYPLVAANVTLPASAATPDTVTATLTINSTPHGVVKWPGADWAPGSTRRIVVADTTGPSTAIYTYVLTVTNLWNGSSSLTSAPDTGLIAVVDRRTSAFGAGWWLAGVERLYTASMLWVGGDGGTRQYKKARKDLTLLNCSTGQLYNPPDTNVFGAPNVDRPDTVKFDGGCYTRFLSHGVRVVFDAQGHHIRTINRLSDTTKFTYGNGDTLLTITLPPTGLTYQFSYTNGIKWIATAPSTPNATRADTGMITRGRLTTVAGPDYTRVNYGYASGADSNMLVQRTDRRGFITIYGYDGGKKLVQASIDMGVGQTSISQGWQPLETLGYPPSGAPHAVDTALAYVRYDGPRADVWDTTAFWLDRSGAPRQIVNAAGYKTIITRGDSRWPALATQLQGPTGLITQATYDSRGNVLTVTQVNPLGDGRNAVTTYTWDPTWDFITSITLPQGEITQFSYDAANGNRLWQQPGTDQARKVQFNYVNSPTAFHLLSSVVYPTSPQTRDSIMYDALGNVDSTKTPLGFVSYALKDAIGRDTLTKAPLDVAQRKMVRQHMAYNVASQDTLTVAFSDSTNDSLIVRQHYDPEGNNNKVIKKSSPDPASIDWMTHVSSFDRAGRKISEQLLGMNAIPFQYDLAGNLVNGGRQGGNSVTVSYDVLNRPVNRFGADVASFSYDTLGDILTANNSVAQIRRIYYPNGALKLDTTRLATDYLPAADFTKHVYVQTFGYDLNGRRIWAKHPAQLTPGPDSIAYSYDPVFGQLAALNDVFGNSYALTYDSLGRQRTLTRAIQGSGTIYDTLSYDSDSRLAQRVVRNSAGILRQEALVYDARNKVTNETINVDALTYMPLGPIATASLSPAGSYEGYTLDALGNRIQMVHTAAAGDPDNYRYAPTTGLMQWREEIRHSVDHDTTFYYFDLVGQMYESQHRHYWMVSGITSTEYKSTVSNYDVEHRLGQTTYTIDTIPHPIHIGYAPYSSTETYRYDALGRRVYTRAVRGDPQICLYKNRDSGCLSTLTRTVWDGDQVLYETRVQGDSGNSELEDDVPPPQSYYGVVGYLHAAGIDQPIALWKGAGDLVLPFANWRGEFVKATCPTTDCLGNVYLPANGATSFGDPPVNPYAPAIWHGSLLEAGEDGSGYQYRRNRYFDPNTGRFTQEDPLGLAGGLNLYGFAGGDPVNYSDPFGLCPVPASDCPFGHFMLMGAFGGAIGGAAVGLATAAPTAEVAAPFTVPPAALGGAVGGALVGLAADFANHPKAMRVLTKLVTGILMGVGALGAGDISTKAEDGVAGRTIPASQEQTATPGPPTARPESSEVNRPKPPKPPEPPEEEKQ